LLRETRVFYPIVCEQHQVEPFLKLSSFVFEGADTLIVLDDCAGPTSKLMKLSFSVGVDPAALQHRKAVS